MNKADVQNNTHSHTDTQSSGADHPALTNYVTRVHSSPLQVDARQWNALLAASDAPTPFMRHEYLAALHTSGAATQATGWQAQFVSLYGPDAGGAPGPLLASAPMYTKDHSYGEYIFDWAWARAYQEHGLQYYPKAVIAVPFTPVPGTRILAENASLPAYLLREQLSFCEQNSISSLHGLFVSEADKTVCDGLGLMARQTVQFHWSNCAPTLGTGVSSLPPEGVPFALGRPGGESTTPTLGTGVSSLPPEGVPFALGRPGGESTTPTLGSQEKYGSFDHYLATLAQDKRKKIRAERRKVADAGITWRTRVGTEISPAEWAFFYRCYERTYLEHGNAPYLPPAFFASMASDMPECWVLFVASHEGKDIATSLIAINAMDTPANSLKALKPKGKIAYGRYWGALARVDSLHFEACYYQPLQWCIDNGYDRFEGGAQGEHKMARGLLPVTTHSAHWLAHPQFADAVARFLAREGAGIDQYREDLQARSPYRAALP